MSCRGLEETSHVFVFRRRLQNVLIKTNILVLIMHLQDVFKTFSRCLSKTSSRHLEDVLQKSLQDIFETSWRRFDDVLNTSSDVSARYLEDVFKASSRRLWKMWSKHLQDVYKKHHQVKLLLLTRLRDIFSTFLRFTMKTIIYRKICLGHTSEKNLVRVKNVQERNSFIKHFKLGIRKYLSVSVNQKRLNKSSSKSVFPWF